MDICPIKQPKDKPKFQCAPVLISAQNSFYVIWHVINSVLSVKDIFDSPWYMNVFCNSTSINLTLLLLAQEYTRCMSLTSKVLFNLKNDQILFSLLCAAWRGLYKNLTYKLWVLDVQSKPGKYSPSNIFKYPELLEVRKILSVVFHSWTVMPWIW